jgi:hypothetical protein
MFSQSITAREGGVEKHWYTLLGYVVGGLLTVTAVAYGQALTGGGESTAAVREAGRLALAVVSLVGLAVYPALFADGLSLSGRGVRRRPVWQWYAAFGIGFPVAVYAVGTVAFAERAHLIAFLSHAAAATVTSGAYLYRRHRTVGVP